MREQNTPFKILMTTDTLGGVWTYTLELVKALENYNVQVVLATMGRTLSNHQKQQAFQLNNLQVEESSFKMEWMKQPWEDVNRAGKWLLELEKKHSPDLVHLNHYAHAVLSFSVPVLVVAHSDIYSWWNHVKGSMPPEKYNTYFRVVQQGLSYADYVVAPTNSMLSCINKYYGTFENQKVIPNARDFKKFTPAQKQPFIFSIGRIWDEAKNIKVLEEIAGKSNWPIFIAGDNEHPENLQSDRFDKLHFLGTLSEEETANWFAQASVYVMPAKYEPFGLSILEAALSSCALILGDIESLRENWDGAALFIDPDNPENLEKRLDILQQDTSLRTALANAAYNRAQMFTPKAMASGYMETYQSMLEKAGKPLQPQHDFLP